MANLRPLSPALVALLALSFGSLAQAESRMVGEWAVDIGECDEYRIVYESGGHGFALLHEDGEWRNLGGALWRVEGNMLHESKGEESSTAEILSHERDSVTLINRAGVGMHDEPITFRRCPAR